jgi:hypothetical protein
MRNRIPAICGNGSFVQAAGLMAYGPNIHRCSAGRRPLWTRYEGARSPSDIPVEQPTKFEPVINLKTARALGITIPPSLPARADEVIERRGGRSLSPVYRSRSRSSMRRRSNLRRSFTSVFAPYLRAPQRGHRAQCAVIVSVWPQLGQLLF